MNEGTLESGVWVALLLQKRTDLDAAWYDEISVRR